MRSRRTSLATITNICDWSVTVVDSEDYGVHFVFGHVRFGIRLVLNEAFISWLLYTLRQGRGPSLWSQGNISFGKGWQRWHMLCSIICCDSCRPRLRLCDRFKFLTSCEYSHFSRFRQHAYWQRDLWLCQFKYLPTQYLGSTHRGRMCLRVVIGVSAYPYVNTRVCTLSSNKNKKRHNWRTFFLDNTE